MTTTLVIAINAVLDLGIILALAAVTRLAHRLPQRHAGEAQQFAEPISLRLALAHEERELSRAA